MTVLLIIICIVCIAVITQEDVGPRAVLSALSIFLVSLTAFIVCCNKNPDISNVYFAEIKTIKINDNLSYQVADFVKEDGTIVNYEVTKSHKMIVAAKKVKLTEYSSWLWGWVHHPFISNKIEICE